MLVEKADASYLWLILTVAPAVVDAGTDKQVSSCTLVLPSGEREADIITTGRIRTLSPVVQPLDDTFCVSGPENSLVCQGGGSLSRIRLSRKDKGILGLIAEGSTCSVMSSKVHSPPATDDVIITGEFVDGFRCLLTLRSALGKFIAGKLLNKKLKKFMKLYQQSQVILTMIALHWKYQY
ncbi:hypothetical protein [Sansalvadorimonas verongulae]|uniref:hypothetical protein n=1 Tax=Sansalvadorimonas verongulae TaxID=2172824 RepID=UPI0012BB5402|nr:hypothetical protein [Sansalvadorimonas verongulae]MTI11879.1 hypothetical protein [Sansalvadorimonas verongulae]